MEGPSSSPHLRPVRKNHQGFWISLQDKFANVTGQDAESAHFGPQRLEI